MKWIIPADSEKDIKEIYVITPDEVRDFMKQQPVDSSVETITMTLPERNMHILNEQILNAALEHERNLAVYSPDYGTVQLLRVQESKKAGREYPGLGVGVVIYNDADQVLLTLRGGTTNNRKGVWELPGGTVELHDGLEETVAKEIKEETGLIVKPLGCVDICEDLPEGQHWISFGYVAEVVGGKLDKTREAYKFDDMAFKNPNELPDNTSELTIKVIEAAMNARQTGNYIKIHTVNE